LIAMAAAAPGDAGLQALALSLIFGRRIERLQAAMGTVTDLVIDDGDGDEHTGAVAATEHWTRIDREPVLEIAVQLPDFAIDAEEADGLGLTADGSERLRLRCPPPFSPGRLFAVDRDAVTRALTRLRPEAARRWSQGRIAGWLEVWLQRAGADPAVIGALCGHDPGQRAQMHYTALATDDLLDWWERALREGLGLEPAPRAPSDPRLGSRARLAVELLRHAYGEFANDIAGMTPLANPASREDVAAAHNAFATYTVDLLMFATGHRPVRSPFERVTDYDLDHAVLWVSDKVVRGGPSSRIVALPPAAVAQLRFWEMHLAELGRRLRPFDPDLAETGIVPALNPPRKDAVRPLFFFLDEEGARLEATRKELILRRHDVLPVQENVARHVLRTWLVEQRVAPHAIDAVFGHARLGEEPLTKSASLRITDLRMVAGQAQALLDRIGLVPLASPLCAP
jgi:integrase